MVEIKESNNSKSNQDMPLAPSRMSLSRQSSITSSASFIDKTGPISHLKFQLLWRWKLRTASWCTSTPASRGRVRLKLHDEGLNPFGAFQMDEVPIAIAT
jgi:hypothetical protein